MKQISKILFFVFLLTLTHSKLIYSQQTENVVIVIMDGARYSETFGDPTHEYIPEMYSISQEGAIISNFNNDGVTYTSRAIPALWTGAWTEVRDTVYNGGSTKYAVKPSIFEYFRKQKNIPADKCYYVLSYIPNLWLPSFDTDYGPNYWPAFHSVGSSDDDVAIEAEYVMDTFQPQLLWVYLSDVDHGGHSGIWDDYVNAIANADQIIGNLWAKIQSDPHYANKTTMFVTNDHGRHDAQHGGFKGHGDGCPGCRQIQLLAVGPEIKSNYVSSQYRTIPDMAVTASFLLGIDPEKSSGEVMHELFNTNSINEQQANLSASQFKSVSPNPIETSTKITYQINESEQVSIMIYDYTGKKVKSLVSKFQTAGTYEVEWNCTNNKGIRLSSGFYPCVLKVGNKTVYEKLIITR